MGFWEQKFFFHVRREHAINMTYPIDFHLDYPAKVMFAKFLPCEFIPSPQFYTLPFGKEPLSTV